jgi:hypothetical protein
MLACMTARVREIPGVRIVGEAAHKTGVLSFVLEACIRTMRAPSSTTKAWP